MPTSKKRVKKQKPENEVQKTKNIVKTTWGKVIIVILAAGFLLSIVAGLVLVLVQAWNA